MNDRTNLIIVIIVVIVAIALILWIDRRSRTEGGLFTRHPSKAMRIIAFLLGCVFTLFSVFQVLIWNEIHFEIAVAAAALIAYSLGAGRLLYILKPQPEPASQADPDTVVEELSPFARLFRLMIIALIGITAIVAAFFGCLWLRDHLTTSLPLILVGMIGLIVFGALYILVTVMNLIKIVGK